MVLGMPGAVRAAELAVATPPPDVVTVTWPELVRLVGRHPRLAAARSRIAEARGATVAAGAVPNPTLEGTLGRGRGQVGDARRSEWGLALSIPFGWVAQRGARLDAAQAGLAAAEADHAALRREVLLELCERFWQLAYEQARVASFETLVETTEALARTVRRRVEKGEARSIEATRAEVELEKVRADLDEARAFRAARQAGLGLWLSTTAGQTIAARASLDELPRVMKLSETLEHARASHPSVLAATARIHAAAAELAVEKRARVPSVSLRAFTTSELDRRALGAGVTLEVPVWNWNRGPIAETAARLAGSKRQAEATALALALAVTETHAACQAQALIARRLGEQVVPRSEAAAATLARTFELGEATLLEAIDARRTLIDARRRHLASLVEAHLQCGRLGVLVGEGQP